MSYFDDINPLTPRPLSSSSLQNAGEKDENASYTTVIMRDTDNFPTTTSIPNFSNLWKWDGENLCSDTNENGLNSTWVSMSINKNSNDIQTLQRRVNSLDDECNRLKVDNELLMNELSLYKEKFFHLEKRFNNLITGEIAKFHNTLFFNNMRNS